MKDTQKDLCAIKFTTNEWMVEIKDYTASSVKQLQVLKSSIKNWWNDCMVLYVDFNIISVISRLQFTVCIYLLGFTSTKLGPCSVLPKDTPAKKPRGSRYGSNLQSHCTTKPHRTHQF